MSVLNTIRALLRKQQCIFRELHHEPTPTSEDAARVRNEPLQNGGKALLMKIDGTFALFVLPANRRVDSKAIRRHLGIRKTRFATAEELAELTSTPEHPGLVPGSVPPFGEPILPFPLYIDTAIQQNDRIAFNAGSLTDSIIMDLPAYLEVARPHEILAFSQPPA